MTRDQIGQKIKDIRTAKGLTLKEVSEKSNLSISFLSLVERGLTSVAITSLQKIADVLGENLSTFFATPEKYPRRVIRSYEQKIVNMDHSKYIYYSLSGNMPDKVMEPWIVHLLPGQERKEVIPYAHNGEEFGYVLEGILTFFIDNKEYELYPGDSLHIPSTILHNWANFTNMVVKLLYVSTPKIFE